MVLSEILQRFKGHILNELRVGMREPPSDLNFFIIFSFQTCHPGLSTKSISTLPHIFYVFMALVVNFN